MGTNGNDFLTAGAAAPQHSAGRELDVRINKPLLGSLHVCNSEEP